MLKGGGIDAQATHGCARSDISTSSCFTQKGRFTKQSARHQHSKPDRWPTIGCR